MTFLQLLNTARSRLDDEVADYRWSDTQMKAYINEANSEANRRTRYQLSNALTTSVVANTATYVYPTGAIFLRRAIFTGEDTPLRFTTYNELDAHVPGWEVHTGTPTHIVCDLAVDKFTLYPIPDAALTLRHTCIVEPAALTLDTDAPQLPARFTYGLIDWVCYRAYQNPDVDKVNIPLSLAFLASFEQEFGTRSSALDEIFNYRNASFDGYDGNY